MNFQSKYKNKYFTITILIFLTLPITNYAKITDSLKTRRTLINTSLISSSALSYFGLYQLWYKEYPATSFHFFNDLHEWNYMDKIGHVCTAYHLNKFTYNLLSSQKINKPLLKSSIYSFAYMLGIEAFDAFYQKWGFSNYDLISNGIGTFIFAIQQKTIQNQIINIKFSSHQSNIAHCRPNLLGKNAVEQVFKDYNGQTYWVTLNIHEIFKQRINILRYINLAIGYSIEGFTGARNNNVIDCNCIECENLNRKSSVLLSLDLNLESLKGKNRLLDLLIKPFSILKIPAPTFILNNELRFNPFYF